jgi:hypothetical protein
MNPPRGKGAPPHDTPELHVFWATTPDRSTRRRDLRAAIDGMLAERGWASEWCGCGRRRCYRRSDDAPAPPVSVSYSGPVAVALLGTSGCSVGVDVEAYTPCRAARYGRIVSAVLDREFEHPAAAFVRAEAWAKARACGFLRTPHHFLNGSERQGWRDDGCFVEDIDVGGALPEGLISDWSVQAAICWTRKEGGTLRVCPVIIV